MRCSYVIIRVKQERTTEATYRQGMIRLKVKAKLPGSDTTDRVEKSCFMYITCDGLGKHTATFDVNSSMHRTKGFKVQPEKVDIPKGVIEAARQLAQAQLDLDYAMNLFKQRTP